MIDRPNKNIKPFASNSSAGERTIFGDVATVSDLLNDNLNNDFFSGWEAGLAENGYPPSQYFNALGYTSTALSAYLFQIGISEWNALQDYKQYAFVNYLGVLYTAKNDIVGNASNANPATDTTNWEKTFDETALNNHIADTNNPHSVTKAQVGLDNVDNTSDLDKPISTATQAALNGKEPAFSILPITKGGTGTDNGTTYTTDGDVLRVTNPAGGAYSGGNSSITGAIKITLPQSWTNTMMKMKIEVYDYITQKSFTLEVGGYNYNDEHWYACSAHIISGGDTNHTIRFGHDGNKCCIYIGETDSTWHYPKVAVTEFQAGYSNYEPEKWKEGWSIGIVDTFGTITSTLTDVQVATTAFVKNEINFFTLVDVSSSRANNTFYLNDTGYPIYIWVSGYTAGNNVLTIRQNGTDFDIITSYQANNDHNNTPIFGVVPAGASYKMNFTGNPTGINWYEWRKQ